MEKTLFAFLVVVPMSITVALPHAQAAVLGVPLGGKFERPVKRCPFNTDTVKAPCYLGDNFRWKDGSTRMSIHMPAPNTRPAWAAHASFEVWTDKAGAVQSVTATMRNNPNWSEIIKSMSARYGLPASSTFAKNKDIGSADWKATDSEAHILCSTEMCAVTFRTLASADALRAEFAARESVNSKRPATP